MRFSAALLVKQSCRQLNYHVRQNLKKGNNSAIPDAFSKLPTTEQLDGNKWADSQVKGLSEMRGQFHYRDHVIYFSFDEARVSPKGKLITFVEHKKPSERGKIIQSLGRALNDEEFEESQLRYFRESVIQTALFRSLFHYSDKILKPASFSKETCTLDCSNAKASFVLNFGGTRYRVYAPEPNMVARFYLTKLRASLDYEKSTRFDNSWKRREWEFFKQYVKIHKI